MRDRQAAVSRDHDNSGSDKISVVRHPTLFDTHLNGVIGHFISAQTIRTRPFFGPETHETRTHETR